VASFGAEELAQRIAALLGAGRTREPAGAEADAALIVAEPATPDEIGDLVRMCETDQITLAPIGAARTLAQIRRAPVAIGVSLARLARVIAYEPDDLTVTAEAGATVG
jgi:FAD/FMN-containing dehydrogenase